MSTNVLSTRKTLFGVPFDPVTMREAVGWARGRWEARQGARIATVNSSILLEARSEVVVWEYVTRADLVVCDGMPLVWASRLAGEPLPERVAGIDLLQHLLRHAEADGRSVFFLGARSGVAESAVQAITAALPRLRVLGVHHGFFDLAEESRVLEQIEQSSVDLLVMAMGSSREAMVLRRLGRRLTCGVAIGVGGSLDVLAGRRRRAPQFVQRLGLEWGFRLYQEPGRLIPRYWSTAVGLAALVTKEGLAGRRRR